MLRHPSSQVSYLDTWNRIPVHAIDFPVHAIDFPKNSTVIVQLYNDVSTAKIADSSLAVHAANFPTKLIRLIP